MAEKVLIQLRVSEEEAAEMKRAAELAGRTLPREMQHRLDAYRPGADSSVARALGDLTAIMAARAERFVRRAENASQDRAALLGILKNTIGLVLDKIGTTPEPKPQTGEVPVSQGISWDLNNWLRSGDLLGPETPEEHALTRIGKTLGLAPEASQPKSRTRKEKGS